jgi:hypothetical protein
MEGRQEAGGMEAIVSDSDNLQSPVRSEDVGELEASEEGDGALVVQETQPEVLSCSLFPIALALLY